MVDEPRQLLARQLAFTTAPCPATSRHVTPADDLQLEVRGVGPIEFPVKSAMVRQLRVVARRAPYGKGEQTLVDPAVRDTWEIPKSRVRIDKRRWNATLDPVLESVRDELGLSESVRLRADLHSMLLYEQGQFFAPHQDSEKSDDMIGSLVVMLPSRAEGGELVVGQGDDAVSHRGLTSSLVFVAFYGDTIHEVRPVRSGHRIVLTYNLILAGGDDASTVDDDDAVDGLVPLLDAHFSRPADLRYRRRDHPTPEPPDRLVYLLDHRYTSRGLAWRGLKGADRDRARLLRAAADRLDLRAVLTQVRVNETWSAFEDWEHRTYTPDDDGYVLEELLDSSVELVPVEGARLDRWVDDSELCESTPSSDLTPDGSEYEGYMGNYGNTLDRWYQRAAVVLWPQAQSFVVRAMGDPMGAVAEILDDAANGREAVGDKVVALASRWAELYPSHRQDPKTSDTVPGGVAGALLAVAGLAEDDDDAARLLAPLSVTALTAADAGTLVTVVDRFGLAWAKDWLYEWTAADAPPGFGSGHPWRQRPAAASAVAWACELPAFCRAVMRQEARAAPAVGATLVTSAATWVLGAIATAVGQTAPSRRREDLTTLGPPLRAVLEAADVVEEPDVQVALTEALCGPTADSEALPCLVAAVLEAPGGASEGGTPPATDLGRSGLATIAGFCIDQLQTGRARPPRREDDWRIAVPSDWPDTDDAATLAEFLSDHQRQKLVWPLAKPRRQVIHHLLDRHELPVSHVTERTGSPHKLVLTKADELFTREAAARARDEADLVRLTSWLASI